MAPVFTTVWATNGIHWPIHASGLSTLATTLAPISFLTAGVAEVTRGT